MIDVYRRHFSVSCGPLIEAIEISRKITAAAQTQYREILESIGARTDTWMVRGSKISGIFFDKNPGPEYRSAGNNYWPKKTTRKGKELLKRLDAVVTSDVNLCLKVVGLNATFPMLFANGRTYYPVLNVLPGTPIRAFVSVPWYDVDPEKLKQYKEDREAGRNFNRNLDLFQWEPTADMVPIKAWELQKAFDEYNENLKEEKEDATSTESR